MLRRLFLPLLALSLMLTLLSPLGCGEDDPVVVEHVEVRRADPDRRTPVGTRQVFAAYVLRETKTCQGTIDPGCTLESSDSLPLTAADPVCEGPCTVRRVTFADVSDDVAAFFSQRYAPRQEHAALFEVTPLGAGPRLHVTVRYEGKDGTRTEEVSAPVEVASDAGP